MNAPDPFCVSKRRLFRVESRKSKNQTLDDWVAPRLQFRKTIITP
jgi:hypothetical protein